MQKGNIVDFEFYRQQQTNQSRPLTPVSNELEKAIQSLIVQLRELGPL